MVKQIFKLIFEFVKLLLILATIILGTTGAVGFLNTRSNDEIMLRVKKGEKDRLKAHAEQQGETLNGFINRAIDEAVKRDNDNQE